MKNRYDFLAREFTQKSQPIKIIITWKFEILDLTYPVHVSQHSHEFENNKNATSAVSCHFSGGGGWTLPLLGN